MRLVRPSTDSGDMPPLKLPNGIHFDVSREDYDRLKRLNFSSLKHLKRSPAHYRHALFNPRQDTDALRFGRVSHRAILEPEAFRAETAVWTGGDRRGKEWAAFKATNAGRDILKEEEHERCLALSAAVRADARAAPYVSRGRAEVTVLWTDAETGLECKARLDFLANLGALVDVKTTRSAHPDDFSAESFRYGYHEQAAFYADGYEVATGKRLPYVVLAVEKEAPHVVQPYTVPDDVLALGREQYRCWLNTLSACRRESAWDGYSTEVLALTLPRWARPQEDEEDLAHLGLVVGGEEHGL